MRNFWGCLCLTVFASAAAAEPSGCYVRAYDAAHLAQHPQQRVRDIAVKLQPIKDRPPATLDAELVVFLRGDKGGWYSGGDCRPEGADYLCRWSYGGEGKLTVAGKTLRIKTTGKAGIRLDAEGRENGQEKTMTELSPGEDGDFVLSLGADAACNR